MSVGVSVGVGVLAGVRVWGECGSEGGIVGGNDGGIVNWQGQGGDIKRCGVGNSGGVVSRGRAV